MPRVLTVQQKLKRADITQYNLDMFKRILKEFLRPFVTVDRTWIHHYTLKTKEQTKQWVKLVEVHQSGRKRNNRLTRLWSLSLGSAWYNSYWLPREGKTITAQYHSELLDLSNAEINTNWPHLAISKKILFHQDNAQTHKARWPNWLNWNTNCIPTPRIDQIWPHAIIIYFQIWRNGCLEIDFIQIKRALIKQGYNLKSWAPATIKKASSFWETCWNESIELEENYFNK